MFTLIAIAVVLALAAVGYSYYLHRKLVNFQQVINDLKNLANPPPPVP